MTWFGLGTGPVRAKTYEPLPSPPLSLLEGLQTSVSLSIYLCECLPRAHASVHRSVGILARLAGVSCRSRSARRAASSARSAALLYSPASSSPRPRPVLRARLAWHACTPPGARGRWRQATIGPKQAAGPRQAAGGEWPTSGVHGVHRAHTPLWQPVGCAHALLARRGRRTCLARPPAAASLPLRAAPRRRARAEA